MGKRKSKAAVSRYDSADYLKTEKDVAAYLEACLEVATGDASYLAAALGTIARARTAFRGERSLIDEMLADSNI